MIFYPMKKTFFIATGILCAVSAAFAQEPADGTQITEQTVTEQETDNYVLTTSFSSNWFVSAGAGAQIGFTEHDRKISIGDRISPALNIYVGKWLTPGFGLRFGYSGMQVRGATQSWDSGLGSHSTGKPVNGKYTHDYGFLEHQKFSYFNLHFDIMFNLCNLIGGYNPQRLYSCIPYVGIGYARVWKSPQANEITANVGVSNAFRLSDAVDLNFDINAMMADERFSGETGHRHFDALLGATLGITYKFKPRGWRRSVYTTRTVVDNTAINEMRSRYQDLQNENNRLRNELDARNKRDIVTELIASGNIIFFDIDKSDITEKSRASLSFLANAIKNGDKNTVYTVTGYADKGTGTPEWNETLSKNRAEAARRCLVEEFGIPAAQLQIDYKGGVDDLFYNDPRCSRAVIILPRN